jgi:hypothetical protein
LLYLLYFTAFVAGALVGVFAFHLAVRLEAPKRRRRRALVAQMLEGSEPIPRWLEYEYSKDRSPRVTREAILEARRMLVPRTGVTMRVKP